VFQLPAAAARPTGYTTDRDRSVMAQVNQKVPSASMLFKNKSARAPSATARFAPSTASSPVGMRPRRTENLPRSGQNHPFVAFGRQSKQRRMAPEIFKHQQGSKYGVCQRDE